MGTQTKLQLKARGSGRAWLLGPALVAGVAYLDPGNVAVNMSAGAQFGHLMVWVLVAANAAAWLVQYLSAKLGLVTGSSMAELLGQRIANRAWRVLYGLQAQCVAIATDVAEAIGGAVAHVGNGSVGYRVRTIGNSTSFTLHKVWLSVHARGQHRSRDRRAATSGEAVLELRCQRSGPPGRANPAINATGTDTQPR